MQIDNVDFFEIKKSALNLMPTLSRRWLSLQWYKHYQTKKII